MPNPRAQKPLTLDQVKKDLLSFKEPATALADMTAGGLRGLTLGTFGMPGEIESLSRSAINAMLQTASPRATSSRGKDAPQISDKTFLPTMDELSKRWSPTIPEGVPDQKSRERSADFGETFGKLGVLPGTTGLYGGVYRGVKSIPAAFKHGALEFAKAAGQPSTNIVKSGGGNWLRQGLDEQRTLGDAGNGRAMSGWNRQDADYQARYPERQQLAVANDTVADWANKNMRKYMANQMGTKDDPVRKLAEQDISHFGMRPDEMGEFPYIKPSEETKKLRRKHTERTGESSLLADSSLAQHWENLSDNAIKATTVGDIKNAPNASYSLKAKEDIAPFAEKVPPETPIYNIDNGTLEPRTVRQTLGFSRMMDVMREDIAAGRITPEEVAKWDMEQAVRHVDKRDKAIWKAEAEEAERQAKESAKYFPVHKEYPEGYKWIELKTPEKNENLLTELDRRIIKDRDANNPVSQDLMDRTLQQRAEEKLEEALKYEGETMGHCVGDYCPDVVSGKTRIYSLRDPKGNPRATIEVQPMRGHELGSYAADLPEGADIEAMKNPPLMIRQIKGSGKKDPAQRLRHEGTGYEDNPDAELMPFVQDFVKSGKWSDVRDLLNADLYSAKDVHDYMPKNISMSKNARSLAIGRARMSGEMPDYMTREEYENLLLKHAPEDVWSAEKKKIADEDDELLRQLQPPPEPPAEGMKAGGAVHISNNPDTMAMELQDQHYQAGGVVRGLKALKMAMHDPEAIVSSARGATKFAEPTPKTMSVIKEKGGNWLGGSIAGGVDKRLKSMKPYTDQSKRIDLQKAKIASMENAGSYLPESIQNAKSELTEIESQQAVNNWIERNVGNYVKKEMATPEDPVRLMLEKRAQEIEAQFQVDMNRAGRTRARAEAEPDQRRQANLMRQAQREEEQAKFDRDFANEHATHLPKDEYGPDEDALNDLKSKREEAGFAPEGMAKSEPAQRWENLSDEAVDIQFAKNIQKQQAMQEQSKQANLAFDKLFNEIEERYPSEFRKLMDERGVELSDEEFMNVIKKMPIKDKASFLGLEDQFQKLRKESFNADRMFNSGLQEIGEENPFVSKLDPETKLYSAYIGDLGIDHVVDVIKQDVAAGRIRPEQLNKLTMDQAVKRTAEFNMEQAQKMRETAIKNTEGMPVHKEYPEEGYKWVELAPKTPKPKGGGIAEGVGQDMWRKAEEPALAEALKYEGDTMGHCVGGYCPDVLEGRSRIYSLRDKRGEPHVTIEVNPNDHLDYNDWFKRQPEEIQNRIAQRRLEDKNHNIYEGPEYLADRAAQPPNIRQIKGKGNARPVEKYDPYTQDFVKSGNWEGVRDLENTGLRSVQGKYYTEQELTEAAKKYGRMGVMDTPWEVARQRHMDAGLSEEDALANWVEAFKEGRGRLDIPPEGEGMKAGGKVHVSDNCDCMRMELDNKKFAMGGAVEGENDVGSPSPQNSASPVAGYQAGGAVKGLAALKQALTGGSAEAAKAARVAALRQSGLSVAEAKARVELAEQAAEMKQALKASEALAKIEGKHLNITQADRTKVGEGYLGGPGFSGLQMKEGPHKDVGAVWGVKNTGTAKTMLGGFDKPLGKEYFTTMIGSPTQHQSNQMVFDKLYKDFTAQAKKGNLDPELHQKINDRLASAVDKDGNAIFPPDIDILSKNFKKQASTFDQRAVAGNVLGGVGIGGKKGQIIDYEKIIRDTTDPFLLDTPSGDLGYRIWTPSGEVIERPDLHPAFPAIATGEDLGVEFAPADKNILLAPFLEKFRAEKGRDPGYMDMTRGRPARVQITEPLLKNLQESGNKAGGAVKATNKYSDGGAISALMKHAETAGQSARMNNQRM